MRYQPTSRKTSTTWDAHLHWHHVKLNNKLGEPFRKSQSPIFLTTPRNGNFTNFGPSQWVLNHLLVYTCPNLKSFRWYLHSDYRLTDYLPGTLISLMYFARFELEDHLQFAIAMLNWFNLQMAWPMACWWSRSIKCIRISSFRTEKCQNLPAHRATLLKSGFVPRPQPTQIENTTTSYGLEMTRGYCDT